ncbi:MAG TPA: hypothetical protein VGW12_15655 [Pyrinomonadaceae bacterium]|nr:hypothetical protein [Pyrinomonadaceae bacterium]
MKNSPGIRCSLSLRIVVTAALVLCATNCGAAGGDANRNASGGNSPTSTSALSDREASQRADNAAAQTSSAQDSRAANAARGNGVLIDYRNEPPDHQPPTIEAELRRRLVRAAYGAKAAPEDYSINSRVEGSFINQGARETVYLLQRGGAVAADPAGAEDLALVVLDSSGQTIATFKTADFNFIVATADTDADGLNELLLEGSFFNMGTLGSSARLVNLKSKQLRSIKTFDGVYENPCEADPSAQVTAAVIRYTSAASKDQTPAFQVAHYRAPCPRGGGQPPFDSFTPAPDANSRR